MSVGVLDGPRLARLFERVAGRRLLGVVLTNGCLELVFSDERPGGNLISIYTDYGRHTGLVSLGGVVDSEGHVAGWQEWLEEAA
jgi:hypothetical protein